MCVYQSSFISLVAVMLLTYFISRSVTAPLNITDRESSVDVIKKSSDSHQVRQEHPLAYSGINEEHRDVNENGNPSNSRDKRKKRNRNRHRKRERNHSNCPERTVDELKDMLGPAFNGRYMSVDKPIEDGTIVADESADVMSDDSGRQVKRTLPFHVSANFTRELPPDFFLEISWYQEVVGKLPEATARFLRRIRSVLTRSVGSDGTDSALPWQCKSEIVWTDLGANYYPRFLRNIRCTGDNCWFGHFKCRAKAFTVNVLKRIRDSCKDGDKTGHDWIYEERAVTFCCECVEY